MVKSELINRIVAKKENLLRRDVEASVHALLEHLSHNVSSGVRIEIRGFGSFNLHHRDPRQAHNPKTGERVYTESKYIPHFKPGKELRDRVNANRTLFAIRDTAKDDDEDDADV